MSLYPLFPGWRLAVDSGQMEVCYSSLILVGVKLGNTDVRPATNVAMQWRQCTSPYHVSCKGVTHSMVFWAIVKISVFWEEREMSLRSHEFLSLRKQPTFRDAATGFLTKWRLSKERRNSILMMRHYPDLGSASDWMKQIINQSGVLPRSG